MRLDLNGSTNKNLGDRLFQGKILLSFLVNKACTDLIYTGTFFGTRSPKGQEPDDYSFAVDIVTTRYGVQAQGATRRVNLFK